MQRLFSANIIGIGHCVISRRTASLCVIGVRDIVQKCLFIDFVDFSEQFVVRISPCKCHCMTSFVFSLHHIFLLIMIDD